MAKDEKPDTIDTILGIGATDLTSRALNGQIGRAYGRDAEVDNFFASLLRKRNVLLLGPSDVGKTAILHEATHRMARRQRCPKEFEGKWVVAVATGAVLAGTKYLGEWQTRLTTLLDAVKADRDVLLYIEDIWALRDAGRASDERDGFSTLLRPYLERGDLTLIGESTPDNYNSGPRGTYALANDYSMMKHFDVLHIEEPSLDTTKSIVAAVAKGLRQGGTVRIEANAIERAIELARRYLPYQAFPGKATRLLTEAAQPPRPADTSKSAIAAPIQRIITADVVTASFSRLTGLPEKILSDAIALSQEEIVSYFGERVVGQEEAVNAVADIITLIKAEMNDPARPLGVLFFVGPTGVGKTELAKTLAEYLFGNKDKLIRLDMSEFKSPASIHDFLQQLTDKQRRQSFSVLLLDEIEKASPVVFDLFLQVFGDGRITDAVGQTVDLHNTIIIMTSNIGNRFNEGHGIGFVNAEEDASERSAQVLREVEGFFRPEFINRLDKIVVFLPLGLAEMRRIARRELGRALLREGVTRRNILIDFRDEVLDILLLEGFSPAYGARPLQRAIRDQVLVPLARTIALSPGAGEQLLELCARDGRIAAEIIPLSSPGVDTVEVEDPLAKERLAVADPERGRTRSMDLRQMEQAIEDLRVRVETHIASERFEALREAAHALLEEMGRPSFWDDQEQSRLVMSEMYQIDRMTTHFAELRDRTEGLVEQGKMIRRHGDVAGLSGLASSYEQLEGEIALAELELLASDQKAAITDTVFLLIAAVDSPKTRAAQDASVWPEMLRDMYLGWARSKGYDAEAVNDGGDPVIVVRGPALARMLCGEEGLHKLQRDHAPNASGHEKRGRPITQVSLARVEVLPAAADDPPGANEPIQVRTMEEQRMREQSERVKYVAEATDERAGLTVRTRAEHAERVALALLRARTERLRTPHPAADEVVRLYHLGKTQYVRDKRTNERDGQARRVLEGHIDRFLLAYLHREGELR